MDDKTDDLLRMIWKNDIPNIDKHLPRRRIPLSELLMMKVPEFELKNGEKSVIFKEDLEKMSRMIPRMLWGQVRLPFIFKRNDDVYELEDVTILENWVIDKILGFTSCSPFLLESYQPRGYYYPFELRRLRKRCPSLVVVAIIPRSMVGYLNREMED